MFWQNKIGWPVTKNDIFWKYYFGGVCSYFYFKVFWRDPPTCHKKTKRWAWSTSSINPTIPEQRFFSFSFLFQDSNEINCKNIKSYWLGQQVLRGFSSGVYILRLLIYSNRSRPIFKRLTRLVKNHCKASKAKYKAFDNSCQQHVLESMHFNFKLATNFTLNWSKNVKPTLFDY